MEYTKLGNTDIEISKLCVGCMSFGKPSEDFHKWTLDSKKTEDVVRHALELAWQFSKGVSSPIIGATKAKYFDDAVGAFDIKLSDDDIAQLEKAYVPHKIVGAL